MRLLTSCVATVVSGVTLCRAISDIRCKRWKLEGDCGSKKDFREYYDVDTVLGAKGGQFGRPWVTGRKFKVEDRIITAQTKHLCHSKVD